MIFGERRIRAAWFVGRPTSDNTGFAQGRG